MKQGELPFPNNWGGRRKRAGRKPNGKNAGVSHHVRPILKARFPVHVTMKLKAGLPSLRRSGAHIWLLRAFSASNARGRIRIAHYSIQSNHLHLLVEADDREMLSRGVQGLAIRIACGLNKWWKRKGKIFADRFHSRLLKTPREVRYAIRYVLMNAKHHGVPLDSIDPFSSTKEFDGWKEAQRTRPKMQKGLKPPRLRCVLPPKTWLLLKGWRKGGPLLIE